MEFDTLLLSRLLTGITLCFHIIMATVGVGIPIFFSIAELIGIKKKDHHYNLLARRWARGYVIVVAVGVVTGTIIGLQLSLLWPSFMQAAGQIISLPLFLETFAFFFEAIFLGIYLYTWDRFKPIYHWMLSLPIIVGASASAFFITTANAFMNTPQGFVFENGLFTNVQPLVAMFNPATPTKVAHVLTSAYFTSAFILAAISAFLILKGKSHVYYKKALHIAMIGCFVFGSATVLNGDFAGKFLAKYQPEKLAAAEWHFETETRAKLILGGILDEEEQIARYALNVPLGLSILAHNTPDAEVIGLNEFPENLWPPLLIHHFFNWMIFIGMFLLTVSGAYLLFHYITRFNHLNRWLLRLIVLGGPLAILAIEFGWIMTEVGRQPWILRGYMKVSEGVTTNQYVAEMLILFSLLYIILGVLLPYILIRLFSSKTAEMELEKREIIL